MKMHSAHTITDGELWETMHRLFGEARGYLGGFDVPQRLLDALDERGFIENDNRPTPEGLKFMMSEPRA